MSTIGTGVAAGVAQTSLQAQQVARENEKRRREVDDNAQRVRDAFEAHMQTVEEGEAETAPGKLHIDPNVPRHEHDPGDEAAFGEAGQTAVGAVHASPLEASDVEAIRAEVLSQHAEKLRPSNPAHEPDADEPAGGQAVVEGRAESADSPLYKHVDLEA